MKIRLNGTEIDILPELTISGLIKQLELNPKGVAVERNLEIVPKSQHATTALVDGDQIEIVEFVGGG